MNVVLDTSVVFSDFYFRKADSRILLDSVGSVTNTVVVPEVVVRELVNKHREALEKAYSEHQRLMRSLRSTCFDPPEKLMKPGTVREGNAQYAAFLQKLLRQPGWLQVPIPDISHDRILSRELARKKPFSSKGSGYRDYLIWESLLQFTKKAEGPVHFITNNTHDFAEGAGFHPDLQADLRAMRASDRVRLHTSVASFVEECILPTLEVNARVQRQIERNALAGFNLRDWFRENRDSLVYPEDLSTAALGTGSDGFHCHFHENPEILSLAPSEVRTLNSGDVLVHVIAKVRAEVYVWSTSDDFEHHEVREFWGSPAYGDVSLSQECEAEVRFALVLKERTHDVIAWELLAVSGETTELSYVSTALPKA